MLFSILFTFIFEGEQKTTSKGEWYGYGKFLGFWGSLCKGSKISGSNSIVASWNLELCDCVTRLSFVFCCCWLLVVALGVVVLGCWLSLVVVVMYVVMLFLCLDFCEHKSTPSTQASNKVARGVFLFFLFIDLASASKKGLNIGGGTDQFCEPETKCTHL